MDLWQATGVRLATDTYEFTGTLVFHDGRINIDFTVTGWRYCEEESVKKHLYSDTHLLLQREPSNSFDHHAVLVLSNASIRLEYVAAFYSWAVAELLQTNNDVQVSVLTFETNSEPDNPLRIAFTSDALFMVANV